MQIFQSKMSISKMYIRYKFKIAIKRNKIKQIMFKKNIQRINLGDTKFVSADTFSRTIFPLITSKKRALYKSLTMPKRKHSESFVS
ncbi:hypothetical protein BpHYR1_020293, partial [Brachionus plicatilis]